MFALWLYKVDSTKVFYVFGTRLFSYFLGSFFGLLILLSKDTNSTSERVLAWQEEIKERNIVLCSRKARTVNAFAGRCTMVPTVFEMERRIREIRFVHSSERQKENKKQYINGVKDHSFLNISLSNLNMYTSKRHTY